MRVPVKGQERECGVLWAEQRGLYTVFYAEVQSECVCRLYAVYESGEAALGIPAPEGDRLSLRVSVPTSRLPQGQLLCGSLRPKDSAWKRFPGGMVGAFRLPEGFVLGRRYRFPWRPGAALPCEALLCFFSYIEEKGFLELTLDENGRPCV